MGLMSRVQAPAPAGSCADASLRHTDASRLDFVLAQAAVPVAQDQMRLQPPARFEPELGRAQNGRADADRELAALGHIG